MLNVYTRFLASQMYRKCLMHNKIIILHVWLEVNFSSFCLYYITSLVCFFLLQSSTVCVYIVTTILMNKNVSISMGPVSGLESAGVREEIHQRATEVGLMRLFSSFCSRHLLH